MNAHNAFLTGIHRFLVINVQWSDFILQNHYQDWKSYTRVTNNITLLQSMNIFSPSCSLFWRKCYFPAYNGKKSHAVCACLCVPPFQSVNKLIDFQETWYDLHPTKGTPTAPHSTLLLSVTRATPPSWQRRKTNHEKYSKLNLAFLTAAWHCHSALNLNLCKFFVCDIW